MHEKNLLIISNNFPNQDNSYIADIFVKEQIKYLKNYFNKVYVISPVAYGIERLRKTTHKDYQYDNVNVYFQKYFNFPFFYNYSRSLWINLETRAILSVIKKEKIVFDLIHAHFTWPSGAVAVELKRTFNVPVIVTEGSSRTLQKELLQMNPYYIGTYQKCDAIIRNNIRDVPLFWKAGISKSKIHYADYGYDPKKFYPIPTTKAREIVGIDSNRKILVNISRLYEEKGQKYLINAMKKVLEKYPLCVCYIGGTGPMDDSLQQMIHQSHLEDHIKMIGFVPDDLLSSWINSADLFILPSLMEGNPTVMFECLGCGIPFLGTNVGGIPEIITSEEYGLIIEAGNAADLAEKIIFGLERRWDREKILAYAERFSAENSAKSIMAIYQKAGYIASDS